MHGEWRKSSFSGSEVNCVEVAYTATVRVRDSKNPDGGMLRFPDDAWSPLIDAVTWDER
ncbi:DUF397 domain-containing protein [Alloactinosynnema sp. L-07]|uniref:DUF397 domain-containing protein n=1 Tax=Alloactinosynnema sp. L-07 TaxID=1653480 RepID=UPI0009EE4178|nr:DUF397 domain-containing protein [Alloactinosynnema sp. L-07]